MRPPRQSKRKLYRLRDLAIDRTDLVVQGANQHATIELFKSTEGQESPIYEEPAMSRYQYQSRSEILAEVEAAAQESLDLGLVDTIEQGQSEIWEMNPELYDEYQALPVEAPAPEPVAKTAPRRPRLQDRINAVVKDRAILRQLERSEFSKSLEEVIGDVWLTDEGKQLFDLYVSPLARTDEGSALATINKSAEGVYSDALEILKKWES